MVFISSKTMAVLNRSYCCKATEFLLAVLHKLSVSLCLCGEIFLLMKSAAIISKPTKPELAGILPELLTWFQQHGYKVYLDEETAQYITGEEVVTREEMGARHPDFAWCSAATGPCSPRRVRLATTACPFSPSIWAHSASSPRSR